MVEKFTASFEWRPTVEKWASHVDAGVQGFGEGATPASALDEALSHAKNSPAGKISSGLRERGDVDPTLEKVRDFVLGVVPKGVTCTTNHAKDRDEVEVTLRWRDFERPDKISPNREVTTGVSGLALASGEEWKETLWKWVEHVFR